ncbi:MAG: nitrogenase [Spirochaetaceae bacterium]|jgi:nitrogenase molybdenum-iron protein alpha chain|nr:nitrogenase [Spirochaetaceae bacterium]
MSSNTLKIERAAPPREDRLGAGTAFCGDCEALKSKIGIKGNGCLNQASRSFSQSFGCQFTLSLAILNTLQNTVVVVHGPVGCGFWSVGGLGASRGQKRLRDPSALSPIWISSNLDEHDVINGGEKKLCEAVLYADREFRPEAIVVASSCVPALIGDDVDAILEKLQRNVSAELVSVNCEGFKTRLMATAYDAVYNGILKNLTSRRIERESRAAGDNMDDMLWDYRKNHTVNVCNVGSMGRTDELELQRLLNALELNVNFLPCFTRPRDFRRVLDAALNVSICATHDDYYLKHIKEHFGIPYIIGAMPIGRKSTARWLMDIARFFNIEDRASALIEKEDAALDQALEPYRAALKGKRAYVSGGEIRIFVTGELLRDLGLEIAGYKAHHVDEFMKPFIEEVENPDKTFINVASQQPFEQANIVRRLNPDVIVIHTGSGNITSKHGIPVFPLFLPANSYMGYSGVFEVAYRLKRIISNCQYNRNMKRYRPLPYRAEWYEKEVFSYIK